MIDFKEIELQDQPLFNNYFSGKQYENSELTFTNLFIWRNIYHFRYAIIHNHLCIMGIQKNRFPLLFPPIGLQGVADYKKVLPELIDIFLKKDYPVIIKAITEDCKAGLERDFQGKMTFKEDRNNYDYVYNTNDLIELQGKRYRQKRNHINKFNTRYQYEYEPVHKDNINECIAAAHLWAEKRSDDQEIQDEKKAIIEALTNYDDLQLQGGALRINGSIHSFSLGELLNPNMAVIHIEKANTEYEGCYAVINQEFTSRVWSAVPYINREEDMGIPGLRKAKESYYPIKMIIKYTGFFL